MVALARILAGLLLVLTTAACSSSTSTEGASADVVPPDDAVAAIQAGADVIDVRTPEEYRDGHLPEARNIDVSTDDFEARIGELDTEGSYVVYCRTGSRSAAAVRTMLDAGFDDVVNGGGYEDLVDAGAG